MPLRLRAVILTSIERQKRMATTNGKYGIKITYEKGPVGWIVGKDGDIMLFPDKASAAAALKKMISDDRYSWNCDASAAEFPGWGR